MIEPARRESETPPVGKEPAGGAKGPSLHFFEVEGARHVFDPESGRFFRIDEAAELAIRLFQERAPEEEIRRRLSDAFPPGPAESALREVSDLVAKGLLCARRQEPEEKPARGAVKPRMVSVTLNVVSSCNLSCIYCWNKGGTYGRTTREKRMTAETAIRAIDLAVLNSLETDQILIDFYGGELLLNFEVLRAAMEHCEKISKETKRTFSYKVTTNGTLLTEEMVAFFDRMGVSLGVSIDGTKKIHDRNRPFPDGKGTWKEIQKNIRAAVEAGNIHVSARATLVPPDLDMVKALKGLFRLGFRDTEIEFASEPCELFNPNGTVKFSDADIDRMKEEYLKFAKFYLGYALHGDEAIDVGISNNLTRVLHESHRFSPCGAGSNFACVTEEGNLYPCMGFIGMPGYKLGTVESGFDIEKLESFRHDMRTVVFEAEECDGCWARYVCAGNCPANNVQYNQKIFEPHKRSCDWLKFQLETAMWVASELQRKKPDRLAGYEPA
ncbi:MAG: SPASM domain-containing protein [Candidatus Eisenbacteria bacterium]